MPFISSVRGSFGALNKQRRTPAYLTVSPAVNGKTVFRLIDEPLIITTAGEYSITADSQFTFRAKLWGAGGGGAGAGWSSSHEGGAGGYATGIVNLGTNTSFKIIVGEGGYGPVTGPTGNGSFCTIGGGASSSPPTSGSDYQYSASGGGFSGIFTGTDTIHTTNVLQNSNYKSSTVQARSVLIAGGGGGGGNETGGQGGSYRGGHGGGTNGTGGFRNGLIDSTKGTQTAVGTWDANGIWNPSLSQSLSNYGVPGRMQGGPGEGGTYGGGGGGGYYGGSSSTSSSRMGGGGGGSGYFNSSFVSSATLTAGTSYDQPGNYTDSSWASPSGIAGVGTRSTSAGTRGNDGRVVITLT